MSRDWTEEQIAALIDGSIEDEREAEALRRILDSDPEAQAYADQVRGANALLREAFDVPADEPTPAAIQAALFGEPDKVAVLKPRRNMPAWVPTSIAASLALVIGLGLGGGFDAPQERVVAALGNAPADGPLHAALETLPSGSGADDGIVPMLSFRDGQGRFCREFEVMNELPGKLEFGIACRTDAERWHVEIVVAAPMTEPGPDGYAPASGAGATALDAMLDALEAGPTLAPDVEADLLKQGWSQ